MQQTQMAVQSAGGMGSNRTLARCQLEFPFVGIVFLGSVGDGKTVSGKISGSIAGNNAAYLHAVSGYDRMDDICHRGLRQTDIVSESPVRLQRCFFYGLHVSVLSV